MKFIKGFEIEGNIVKKYIGLYIDAVCLIFEGDKYAIFESYSFDGESVLESREAYPSEINNF